MQLKHYHYNKVLLEANKGFSPIENGLPDMYCVPNAEKIHTQIRVNQPENLADGAEPFYALEIKFAYKEEDFPYLFDVELFGIISCDQPLNEKEDKHDHLFVVNSVSMLYSAVRDQLLTLSARHQYGPMMLPSLDFRSLTKAED